MLRVADWFSASDVGRQRRHNEDSHFARTPLFAVADGMGGAQAGEVASRTAVEFFEHGIGGSDGEPTEERLAALVRAANARIHELSQQNADQAGMGTTMTAVYVGPEEVVIAHVGDSRAYRLRDGVFKRLTDDHSLVDELVRQGRLTPEEAYDHPQRSVILRALGPEATVDVDTLTHRARAGDIYLLNSDGLTTMVHEERVGDVLRQSSTLRDAGLALIGEANAAGGRDNITVILFRLEEVGEVGGGDSQVTAATHRVAPTTEAPTTEVLTQVTMPSRPIVKLPPSEPDAEPESDDDQRTVPRHTPSAPGPPEEEQTIIPPRRGPTAGGSPTAVVDRIRLAPPPRRDSHGRRDSHVLVAPSLPPPGAPPRPSEPQRPARRPRMPPRAAQPSRLRRMRARMRRFAPALIALVVVLALLGIGGYVASTAVYFVGTNSRGFVTIYSGLPYTLPGGVNLYTEYYVSGVPAATVPSARRTTLLNHQLRSQAAASNLVRALELGQISGVTQNR